MQKINVKILPLILLISFCFALPQQVLAATISSQVNTSSDDGEENASSRTMYLNSTDLELVSDGSTLQTVGMRFANIGIPKGAQVTSAYLEFTVDESKTTATNLVFYGQAASNPTTFTTVQGNISSRPKTTAQVSWNLVPSWTTVRAKIQTPDISSIIQEIVNQSGWVSNNAIAIIVTGSGTRTASAFESSAAYAAKLVITYNDGATPTPSPTSAPSPTPTPTPTPGASFNFTAWSDTETSLSIFAQLSNQAKDLNPEFTLYNGDGELGFPTDWMAALNGNASNGMYDRTFAVRGNGNSNPSWPTYFNFASIANNVGATRFSDALLPLANETYSFDYGNSRFIGIDTPGCANTINTSQLTWVTEKVSDAETLGLSHVFLFMHGPIWYMDGHTECTVPTGLTDLITSHPIITASFHGHEHVKSVSFFGPLDTKMIMSHDFVQVLAGGAGGGKYNCNTTRLVPGDYCGSFEGFADVTVDGLTVTVNFYQAGSITPVKTIGFTKAAVTPTPTPSPTPTPTPTPTPSPTPSPTPQTVSAVLGRTIDSSLFIPPSPDTSGITYVSHLGRMLIADSEVDEMPIYNNTNLWDLTLEGMVMGTSNTLTYSYEPTGVSYNPNNHHLYISDDDRKRINEINPGADDIYFTGDDTYTYISTLVFGNNDPEGLAYVNGDLYSVDGTAHTVYHTTADGTLINSFDVGTWATDPEGIAYHPGSNTLFLVDINKRRVTEYGLDGTFIRIIDISAANPVQPADLVFAPSSDSLDNANIYNLYVVDRANDNGVDPNENDGKIYELSIPGLPLFPGATPTPTPTPSPTPTPTPTPTPSPSPTPTPTPVPVSISMLPVADTYVLSTQPTSNLGKIKQLVADSDPLSITYLKFNLTPFAGKNIIQAKLKMMITNASVQTQQISQVDDILWTETQITYNNRPVIGSAVAAISGTTVGAWKEVDITSTVDINKGGLMSLGITSDGTDSLIFNPKEAASNNLTLEITYSD